MKTKFEKDTLELPKATSIVGTRRTIILTKSAVSMHSLHKKNDVNSYHETCNHPGVPCGDEYHRGSGHGYCYYCSLCN